MTYLVRPAQPKNDAAAVLDLWGRNSWPARQPQRAVTASLGAGGLRLIYAFPNRQSEGVLRRAGYEVLGPVAHWTRPLRSIDRVQGYLGRSPIARAAAWLVDQAIHATPGE